MRTTLWGVTLITLGAVGAALAMLINAGALATTWFLLPLLVIPLLALATAFVGMMSTGDVAAALLAGVVSFAAPIVDVAVHSTIAGDMDAASGYGFATGVAIIAAGIVAVLSALWRARRRADVSRQHPRTLIA